MTSGLKNVSKPCRCAASPKSLEKDSSQKLLKVSSSLDQAAFLSYRVEKSLSWSFRCRILLAIWLMANGKPSRVLTISTASFIFWTFCLSLPSIQRSVSCLHRFVKSLDNHSDLHSYQRRQTTANARQHATNGGVVSPSVEGDQNTHDASGIQTVHSTALEPRPVPFPNVVIHVIHQITPISLSEQRRDHGGCSLLGPGQHTNTGADAKLGPDLGTRPDPPTRPDIDTGIWPDTEARPDAHVDNHEWCYCPGMCIEGSSVLEIGQKLP